MPNLSHPTPIDIVWPNGTWPTDEKQLKINSVAKIIHGAAYVYQCFKCLYLPAHSSEDDIFSFVNSVDEVQASSQPIFLSCKLDWAYCLAECYIVMYVICRPFTVRMHIVAETPFYTFPAQTRYATVDSSDVTADTFNPDTFPGTPTPLKGDTIYPCYGQALCKYFGTRKWLGIK